MSQRSIKRKIRNAESELAYLDRLDGCAIAITADARGDDWQALRRRLEEYTRYLDARRERIEGCKRELAAQLRGKAKR